MEQKDKLYFGEKGKWFGFWENGNRKILERRFIVGGNGLEGSNGVEEGSRNYREGSPRSFVGVVGTRIAEDIKKAACSRLSVVW